MLQSDISQSGCLREGSGRFRSSSLGGSDRYTENSIPSSFPNVEQSRLDMLEFERNLEKGICPLNSSDLGRAPVGVRSQNVRAPTYTSCSIALGVRRRRSANTGENKGRWVSDRYVVAIFSKRSRLI